ncbi:MAG: DNA polymerase III subunit gamma/tau [Patescibacteria group bacterium]
MFYLKYRPGTVDEIDNSRVKQTIQTLLKSKELPHALLLIGPKGTGKTSVGRIIARKINDVKDEKSSSDIIELDAASNRGIDEIRNMVRESSFLPMVGKYRVFIIDEAHMITNEGFNALLKTLEEPPSTAIFILATTNVEKVPKTIVSRCMTINFGKAKKADIHTMLVRICKAEKIDIDTNTLNLVAEHADNSFRDAAKLLEELVTHSKSSYNDAKEYLGLIAQDNLLEILDKHDLKTALTWIGEFEEKGGNIQHLIEHILLQLRELLLIKSGVQESKHASSFSLSEVTLLIKHFQEAYNSLKTTPIEIIPLELAVVDFYNSK